jgi:hypothetical protein
LRQGHGFVLAELRSTLEWYFDDGKKDEADAQLERLVETHDGAASQDAVAAALFDFAALAERHRSAIIGLGGFRHCAPRRSKRPRYVTARALRRAPLASRPHPPNPKP